MRGEDDEGAKSFSQLITEGRKRAQLTQREVAARIVLENGKPISMPYLNDLEHGQRKPPRPHLIEQFARVLEIPADVLYFAARRFPADIDDAAGADPERVMAAFNAFRRALKDKGGGKKKK